MLSNSARVNRAISVHEVSPIIRTRFRMDGLAIAAIESISNNLGKEMKISMILEMVESILSGTFLLKNLTFDSTIPAKAKRHNDKDEN